MSKSYKRQKWYDDEYENDDYASKKKNDRRKMKQMKRALKTRDLQYFQEEEQ